MATGITRPRLVLLVLATIATTATDAAAQDDPENLYFESQGRGTVFGWSFGNEGRFDEPVGVEGGVEGGGPGGGGLPDCGRLTRGSDEAFAGFGNVVIGGADEP